MTTSINQQLVSMQNQTTQMEAQQEKKTGSEQELDQDMFLKLMLEQLKYQDPLEPTGNTEFLQQQATFTQVSELQKLNSAISNTNQIMQSSMLIGKQVTIEDPSNSSKTISGIVNSASFAGTEATIEINGTYYPTSLVIEVAQAPSQETELNGQNDQNSSADEEKTATTETVTNM